MIDTALAHIATQLNQNFRRNFQVAEDLVVLSNLLELSGAQVPTVANKLVLFLSSIERDTTAYRANERGTPLQTSSLSGPAPVYLNLLVMFAANFSGSNYPEALKFLSSTIAYFQGTPVLDHHNTRDLDPRIERLVLNIENLSSSELHSLWSVHGGRYLPSVLYRVRMVWLDSGHVHERRPQIREIETGTQAGQPSHA